MRRASNVDLPQKEATKQLRQMGVSVQPLHSVGSGCADLLCGFRGVNILIEMKSGEKAPSARQLNTLQVAWHAKWAGQVAVANTPEEACDIVLAVAGRAGR